MDSKTNKTLVIVESPAKAKTISQFLGKDYVVEASFGHIRDLPNSASEIPVEYKKHKWSRLGVNVDQNFDPIYIIPADKKKHVSKLKEYLKYTENLLLATDEDREGESISWHLVQVLKPSSDIKIGRIVFHEITKTAILSAVKSPRSINESLVKSQESRRILDRLYGYTLSPLLWKKIAPRLSAGRVQSVATKILVERELLRKSFHSAEYWDLSAEISTGSGKIKANLIKHNNQKVAIGKSFDPNTGKLSDKKHILIDENTAILLSEKLLSYRPWKITRLDLNPATDWPVPPFTTSTLQQEANRKLRFASKKTMQVAQSLYEGVDLFGERVGLITYMRTDSLTISEKAIQETRDIIKELYGEKYLPEKPNRYKTKSKNAQEAHEAIRPTNMSRRPQDLVAYLSTDQYKLYEMIWKRTTACQMVPAQVQRTIVEISADTSVFQTTGKLILFPGFLRAYVEGSDDPEIEIENKETILPPMSLDQIVDPITVTPISHQTKPPSRYTEASLVKKLEEEGIGRPSTYATIISTIQDRGYIFKRSNELIPTFTAIAVTNMLEKHFTDLIDIGFTSNMENQLDEIASGTRDPINYLKYFYLGNEEHDGLVKRIEQNESMIEFTRILIGEDPSGLGSIVVKIGKYGPFLQRGDGGASNTANIPKEIPPADLTLNKSIELLLEKSAKPIVVGIDQKSALPIYLQKGRFGSYLQLGTQDENEEQGKPKRIGIPKGLIESEITSELAEKLISLPRTIGVHPEKKLDIISYIGKFGPFIKCGNEYRNLESWIDSCDIELDDAIKLLSLPKTIRKKTERKPLKELGTYINNDTEMAIRILDGRYGPYITDGVTNAPISRHQDYNVITKEFAIEALLSKKEKDFDKPIKERRLAKKIVKNKSENKQSISKIAEQKEPIEINTEKNPK